MEIHKNIDVYMDLSVDDIVALIWEMDAREQAELLFKLNEFKEKNYPSALLQIAFMCDEIEKFGVKEEVQSFIKELADSLEV